MPHRSILRLLLAGLLASVPSALNPGLWALDPPAAHADGPGDWPMFGHDPAHTGRLDLGGTIDSMNFD